MKTPFLLALLASAASAFAGTDLPRSTPEAEGVSSSAILSFVEAADRNIDALHSFMLLRHGRVVAEGWWAPYDATSPHVLFSLSKSFTSTAVGLAVAEGKLSVDDPVLGFFPEDAPAEPTANLRAMRVRDLLRMNTGHETEPARPPDQSWKKAFLSHPVRFKPGTHFLYNTSATYMLAAIVEKTTGTPLLNYLQPRLFAPLGIENPTWELSPEGIAAGGYGLSVRTEDIARLGQLCLQKGSWQGKRLLPESWVDAATSFQTSNGSNPRSDWDQGYGYQFWRCRNACYRGDGAFGQYCIVMPHQDAVIAITGGLRDMQAVLDLVWDKLLPGMSPSPRPPDAAAREKLERALKTLALRPQVGSATPPNVFGKSYRFPANARKIETATIQTPQPDSTTLVLRIDGADTRIDCGHRAWRKGRAAWGSGEPQPLAASGAWTAADTFTVKVCRYETPFVHTLNLKFAGDELRLNTEVNVAFGPTKDPELVGKASASPDRFVWVFGWGLERDTDVAEVTQVIEQGARHGINGAVVSFGLDALCKRDADYFRRLDAVRLACEHNKVELIPAVFSIGYGGGLLSHDRNLAEGLPVKDAPFLARGTEARLDPDPGVRLANGGFEEYANHRFKGYGFHDQPGEVSFADTQIKHGGSASLRMENFTANPHGHGRVNQEVRVQPHRCYRIAAWVKTEGLRPAGAFRLQVLAGDRALAPREFNLPSTTDWRRLTMLFNSLTNDRVHLYAGVWGGQAGKFWIDDWTVEEVGPVNLLRRPGTPIAVRSADGATTFEEGRDFARFEDPALNPWRDNGQPVALKLLPEGRIREGDRLRVSWYHSMLIHDSQVTVCMAEPAVYDIFNHEAKLLAERLRPRRVLLNMDEVRMGGTCQACRGRDMAQLLGESATKQAAAIRRHSPNAEVYVWSDMFDPNHNAHGNYYLVDGDFTGSWRHLPKDLIVAVWGGEPRESSLRFFADQGYQTLVACYYDADDLKDVTGWLNAARPLEGVRGFMYTPWQKKYALLPAFGDLLLGR